MAFDTKWFRERLHASGRSQRDLAKTLDKDPSSVSLLLRGKRQMKMQEATKLAQFLDQPLHEVLRHAGVMAPADARAAARGEHADVMEMVNTHDVPLVGYVDGEGEVHIDREPTETDKVPRVPTPPGLERKAVAVQVRAAMSRNEMFDGWVLYFAPRDHVDPEAIGRLSIVRLKNDGPTLMRVLRRGYQKGTFNLISAGDPTIENVTPAWATPVAWAKIM